jgi:sugar phosphate isomerase/epimerase
MKLHDSNGDIHLTYCTNIHRGESWTETRNVLEANLPAVKQNVSLDRDMGIGLRLSDLASRELAQPGQLESFKDFLKSNGLYVFTINGFPFGPFHGTRVKEDVYQPDWRFAERLAYSNRLADLLVEMLPSDPHLDGSISSVPCTFGTIGDVPQAVDQIVENLLRHVAHLTSIRERTGRTITLALEPEPMCYLDTSQQLIQFMQERIFVRAAAERFAEIAGVAMSDVEPLLRRHLGICYDVCHAAVEFEHPSESISRLRDAGIGIFKLQISAALREPHVDDGTIARLRRFDDGIYLHQVVERRADSSLVRYLDLEYAFARIEEARGNEWRVHCHVPVFMGALPELATTQDFLREILSLHRQSAVSRHLEVETYTFEVLPDELRQQDVVNAIAREISWVGEQLER